MPSSKEDEFENIQETVYGCAFVISELRRFGKIRDNMTDYEKAKVLYQWTILHGQYSTSYRNIDYTPKGFLFNGVGVCQAFTGIFNLLCKMEKIKITGVAGKVKSKYSTSIEEHIWSFAVLDRRPVYIDVTWGNPVYINQEILYEYGINPDDLCNMNFFDIKIEELKETHIWTGTYFEDFLINKR